MTTLLSYHHNDSIPYRQSCQGQVFIAISANDNLDILKESLDRIEHTAMPPTTTKVRTP